MTTPPKTLSYADHHSTFWADWFANFSVLAILSPALGFLALFLCLALLHSETAMEIILTICTASGPVIGFSLAITSLALKTRFRKTALTGLIGCTLWILLFTSNTVLNGGPVITTHPATVRAGR